MSSTDNPVSAPCAVLRIDDARLRADTRDNLRRFGYDVVDGLQAVSAPDDRGGRSKIVLIQEFDATHDGELDELAIEQARLEQPFPVIAIMKNYDLRSHLRAIAAGTVAVITPPIDFSKILDKLESLHEVAEQDPFRVMIVDDSESMATFYANILRQAGMTVEMVINPLATLERMASFSPDLLLMDLYMPECSGIELARAIRQLDSYLSVPIVFLSSEDDPDKQLSSMGLGADDFLTKNIATSHLVTALTIRLQRARRIRRQMISDSLTGLLNHSAVKQRLQAEISRAGRSQQSLCFAMIDIDKFKSINDTHGHPVGDVVIKNLARLLRQRLRAADIVGRYGGEEFAVVLPETTVVNAIAVLDELRKSFASFQFQGATGPFSATFSVGVSAFPKRSDVISLCDAADAALYRAKHEGRNRIVADTISE